MTFVFDPVEGSNTPEVLLNYCGYTEEEEAAATRVPMQDLGINMPSAVIMEENYDKLLEQCEAQELEVSTES